MVVFYLINMDETLKCLLTQREKGGWCSSLMDGPGAQAAPHTTTAAQSRKSMESWRKCASTVETYTPPVATSLQTSKLCWNTGTLSISGRSAALWQLPPSPQRRNLAPASSAQPHVLNTLAGLAHQGQGATHPSHAQTRVFDTNTSCHNKWRLPEGKTTGAQCHPCNSPTADEWQTQLSHWY